MTVQSHSLRRQPRIHRAALVERLNRALDVGSVLLVAGPGYGKTVALEEALAARGTASAWIRCGEADCDAGRLLRRLIEAIRQSAPGSADVLAERLAGAGQRIDVRAATADLIDELGRCLVDPVIVVFDDAEHLRSAPEASRLVGDLLAVSLDGIRIAVAARQPLSARVAKLRSTGRLSEFGVGELAFTPQDCGELLRSAGRLTGEAEEKALFEATGGWPLGAALGALHGDNPTLRGSASRSQLFDFLAEEVLELLPPELRQHALDASIGRELDTGCMRALGLPPDFPTSLAGTGIPLRPLDHDGSWFAYHPLVREFLSERLAAERGASGVRDLHALVAPGLAGAGRMDEAIEHWLQAERWQEAGAAVAETAPALVFVEPATVRRWLQALPIETRSTPACLLLDGTLLWEDGRNLEAVEHLRAAVTGFRDAGDVAGEWLARFALIDPLELMGEWEEAVLLADGFDDERALEAGIIPPAVAAYAAGALGALGRMDECGALSRRILAHPQVGPLRPTRALWESDKLILAGELDVAVGGARKAVSEAEQSDPFNRLAMFALFLAAAVTQQGRDDEALVLWERVEHIGRERHMNYVASNSHAWRALLHARNGRLHPADEELARAAGVPSGSWRDAVMETARARIAALRGDAAEVTSAADRALALAERALLVERMQAAIELAPALLDVGLPARALAVVEQHLALLDALVPGMAGRYFRALLLAVRAALRDAEGDEADAMNDLKRMWAEAGNGAAVDVVRREWRLLERPLWKGLEVRCLEPEATVRAISDAWPGGEPLLPFTEHPNPDVRRWALVAATNSGHPDLAARIAELAEDGNERVAAAAKSATTRLRKAPPPLAFTVLGDFRVRRGGWWVDDAAWDRRVAQRVVRYLLASPGRVVTDDLLLESFWPDVPERSARRRLQVAVSCARAVLDLPGVATVIEAAERTLRLRLRERDTIDADRFERAAAAALVERGSDRLELLEQAASLWTGEPLPQERYVDWAIPWREQLTAQYARVLAALADEWHARGDDTAATTAARRLVELDPLDEAAQRLLILSYARSGRRAHALRQYLECRRVLIDALGVDPGHETTDLQRRILAGEIP